MSKGRQAAGAPGINKAWTARLLDAIERLGNRLPDPALLFLLLMVLVWLLSAALAPVSFAVLDPRTGSPLVVNNLLSGDALTRFLADMVPTFIGFHPLGVVLVAMLGIGVADYTGFIGALIRRVLTVTSLRLLTPMVITVGIISHTAADAGYVLVVPLGAVIFQAAGRHPLAGIAAAFAGVSGGFSASFLPSSLDPMLQGISQAAGQLLDPALVLNPLNNFYFTAVSSLLIVGLGWFVTDRIVEPRLRQTRVDSVATQTTGPELISSQERRALRWSLIVMLTGVVVLLLTALPEVSAWRAPGGDLTASAAPLMQSIVALIFLLFLLPGIVYGYMSGTVKTHHDIVAGMSRSMGGMSYYIVMAFFAAQFIYSFGQSNMGALLALTGASWLREAGLAPQVTIVGVVLITGLVNMLVGSASAKWALLAPILVPMLMALGISPDLTQAAYRVGDSATNIITPLMPYFPLIVVYCRQYVSAAGIGTLVAMMLPYSLLFLLAWTAFLLLYWALGLATGLPLGLGASYGYSPPVVY